MSEVNEEVDHIGNQSELELVSNGGQDWLSVLAYAPAGALSVFQGFTVYQLGWYMSGATMVFLGICFLLAACYTLTIRAFPYRGASARAVALELLGPGAMKFVVSAALIESVFTAIVSSSAFAKAIMHAAGLNGMGTLTTVLRIGFAVSLNIGLFALNRMGGKVSGKVLSIFPIAFYTACLSLLISLGWHWWHGTIPTYVPTHTVVPTLGFSVLLIAMSRYAAGLTGIEVVSELSAIARSVNTAIRAMWINASMVITGTVAVVIPAIVMGVTPDAEESLLPLMGSMLMGEVGKWLMTIATAGILAGATNMAFAHFPVTLRMLSQDKFLPNRFKHPSKVTGVYESGLKLVLWLIVLGLLIFRAIEELSIGYYSVTVFLTIGIAMYGMSVYWSKVKTVAKEHSTQLARYAPNASAAIYSTLSLIVSMFMIFVALGVLAEKFWHGGWVVAFILLPSVFAIQSYVKWYYENLKVKLKIGVVEVAPPAQISDETLVFIHEPDKVGHQLVETAIKMRAQIVHITSGKRTFEPLWRERFPGYPFELVEIITTPDRQIGTGVAVAMNLHSNAKFVVLGELVVPWYAKPLHGHSENDMIRALGAHKHVTVLVQEINLCN